MGLETAAAIVGIGLGAIAGIRAIFTAFRTWEDKRLGKAMREKEVKSALAELRPNSGKSMFDKVEKLTADMKEIKELLKMEKK